MLAALNSIETVVQPLVGLDLFYEGQEWARLRRPEAEAAVKRRLSEFAESLGTEEYLEDRFTAGDLMMTTVLRMLRHTESRECGAADRGVSGAL